MKRTNIVMDDKLVTRAIKLTGKRTKREVVHYALEMLVGRPKLRSIRKYRASGIWSGDLDKMRRGRN